MTENSNGIEEEISQNSVGFFTFSNIKSLGLMIILIFALRWSIASPYHVPTPSMEPTIKVGDRLLAFKLAYNLKFPFTNWVLAEWGQLKHGDIVVFRFPKDPEIDFVKRVVAISGDKVKVINDILYINGEAQPRKATPDKRVVLDDIKDNKDTKILYRETLKGSEHWTIQSIPSEKHFTKTHWPSEDTEFTVPEDSFFVMGDNRDNSSDSRRWLEVPMSYVRGKALFVLWSAYTPKDESMLDIRWSRFGHWLDDYSAE